MQAQRNGRMGIHHSLAIVLIPLVLLVLLVLRILSGCVVIVFSEGVEIALLPTLFFCFCSIPFASTDDFGPSQSHNRLLLSRGCPLRRGRASDGEVQRTKLSSESCWVQGPSCWKGRRRRRQRQKRCQASLSRAGCCCQEGSHEQEFYRWCCSHRLQLQHVWRTSDSESGACQQL